MALINPRNYSINNEPLSVLNIHKYLSYLLKLFVIPPFNVSFDNNEMQIVTVYNSNKWAKNGVSIIKYNILTRKWTSIIDTMTFIELNTHYPYLVENNMVSTNYNYPYIEYVLESYNISDILEPSLNPFDKKYINTFVTEEMARLFIERNNINDEFYINILKQEIYDNINLRQLVSPDVIIINNIVMDDLFIFINDFIQFQNKFNFDSCKNVYQENNINLPEELWDIIYEYYKSPQLDYWYFINNIWV